MLRKVAEEIGTKVEKLQQSKNEKEQEAASLFQFRQYKRDLRRERRRNKRKLAKKLAHQKVSKAYEENSANPQRKTRQPVVRFSTET